MSSQETRKYKLLAPDGSTYESSVPGELGGYRRERIYGRLDCWSANKALAVGKYAPHRVFFANEAAAIAAGYRPCGHCMRQQHRKWKKGGAVGTELYPWLITPSAAGA